MKKISTILILAGIIIAAIPVLGGVYTSYIQQKLMEGLTLSDSSADLQEAFSSESASGNGTTQPNNPDAPSSMPASTAAETTNSNPSAKAKFAPKKSKSSQTVLGKIKIHKIEVEAPIVEGVKAENLRVGIGHMPGTADVGEVGNSVLAGHRSYTFGRFFNRLDELDTGDIIEVDTKDKVFKYSVYEKVIVEPSDLSVLKGSKKNKVLTLITCHPIYIASHRLVIHAKLVE